MWPQRNKKRERRFGSDPSRRRNPGRTGTRVIDLGRRFHAALAINSSCTWGGVPIGQSVKSRSHQMNPGDDGRTEEERTPSCLEIKASNTGKFKDIKEMFVLFFSLRDPTLVPRLFPVSRSRPRLSPRSEYPTRPKRRTRNV